MKKLVLALVAVLGFGTAIASSLPSSVEASMMSYSSGSVNFPTGVFFNGNDFVKVERTWVRIVIGGQMAEYDIRHSEETPYGSFLIQISNGSSITIDKSGRQIYYGGNTYYKR